MPEDTLTNTHITSILEWYTGKARVKILEDVGPRLVAAAERGFWLPKESRTIRAAFNKQMAAKAFAGAQERAWKIDQPPMDGLLWDVSNNRERPYKATASGRDILHAMRFGLFERAPKILETCDSLFPHCRTTNEMFALGRAKTWALGFSVIAKAMDTLDRTRPAPAYIFGTISPSTFANLSGKLGISFTSIRVPPIEWSWRDMVISGAVIRVRVGRIRWPEGTRHEASRFAEGSRAGNQQCHACGHAIRNCFNWVPLVADNPEGPISLWVGRDCASKLFRVEVTGDAVYQ